MLKHNSLKFLLHAALIFLPMASMAFDSTSDKVEVHEFHILGHVHYRCYAGYGVKKVTDEKTNEACDNKDYKQVIVDKVVALRIATESTPDESKELVGSWDQSFEFKKRKFEIAISLFKNGGASPYRIRIVAKDDELTSQQTTVFAKMKSVAEMNPLEVEFSSAGKKEEISFSALVEAKLKK